MEQALLEADALIESTLSLHQERFEAPVLLSRLDGNLVADAVDQFLDGVRHSVSVTVTGAGAFVAAVTHALAELAPEAAARSGSGSGSAPRVAVRMLWAANAVPELLALADQVRDVPMEIRVAEGEMRELLVVDGAVALVHSKAASPDGHAAVVKDPAAVRALELLFAGAWSGARPLSVHLGLGTRLRTDMARRILEKLRAGYTDEEAAGEVGVSLRTYRRHVAEIMRELDATSRFQAGVRAVELGLLPDRTV
ncbi:DNA-binding response regulator [Streptomyces syringium]|uniref:DNA-binding response regulator n=1 Tax=Streptomyces syringium TaxID=76729 RepID=UPI003AAE61BE